MAMTKAINIHSVKSDLRRYGKANVGSFHQVTGSESTGYNLWKFTSAHTTKQLVGSFVNLFQVLEAL